MKTTKLLLIPTMLILVVSLLAVVSAASVTTSLFYDSTTSDNLTINNGDGFGVIVSANSIFEPTMGIVVEFLDSSGTVLSTLWSIQTTLDSYSDYTVFSAGFYPGPGNYTIRSVVTGASGQTDTDYLYLEVLAPTAGNNAPIITSTPTTDMDEKTNYSYQVVATDADNDTLTYSLTQAPTWLSVDSTGLLTGTAPDVTSDYSYAITVEVSDGQDFDSQSFLILVRDLDTPDTTAPVITIVRPIDGAIYTSSSLTFEITTNEDVSGAAFSVDGATIPTTMDGVSRNFTKTVTLTNGSHSIVFYALDLAGNLGTSTTINFVVDTTSTGDTIVPVVTIVNPTNNQTYSTKQITVDFTAVDLNLNSCYYSLNGAANITTTCNTPFTITALEGANTLTVYANDLAGNAGSQTITFNIDTSRSSSRNNGAKYVSDSDGTKQYLSQFGAKTAEEEEILTPVSQPSSFFGLWFWLLVTILILIVAVIIVWVRR